MWNSKDFISQSRANQTGITVYVKTKAHYAYTGQLPAQGVGGYLQVHLASYNSELSNHSNMTKIFLEVALIPNQNNKTNIHTR